jgi:hypothetical protein
MLLTPHSCRFYSKNLGNTLHRANADNIIGYSDGLPAGRYYGPCQSALDSKNLIQLFFQGRADSAFFPTRDSSCRVWSFAPSSARGSRCFFGLCGTLLGNRG